MVPGSCISFFYCDITRAKDSTICLRWYAVFGKALVETTVLMQDPVLTELVWPLKPAVVVDREWWLDILILFVAVWRWNGGSGGEFAGIGDLWSIDSLWVVWRGVRLLRTLFELSYLFRSLLSPALVPLTVFSPSFTTTQSCLLASCPVVNFVNSYPCDFSPLE